MFHFRAQNSPFFLNKILWYKPLLLLYFHLPITPFHCAKSMKKFLQWIQSYEDASFLGPKWFICPKQFFFKKIINIIFIYLSAPFILQKKLKILKAKPDLWGRAIFGPKRPQFVLVKSCWYKPLLLLSSTYWHFSLGKV